MLTYEDVCRKLEDARKYFLDLNKRHGQYGRYGHDGVHSRFNLTAIVAEVLDENLRDRKPIIKEKDVSISLSIEQMADMVKGKLQAEGDLSPVNRFNIQHIYIRALEKYTGLRYVLRK